MSRSHRETTKGKAAIIRRDGYACRKCAASASLDVHHICAVMDGGDDSPDNLITLCSACHREWHLAEVRLRIPFDEWLPLPAYDMLVTLFRTLANQSQSLPPGTSLNDLYTSTMQAHQMLYTIRTDEIADKRQRHERGVQL